MMNLMTNYVNSILDQRQLRATDVSKSGRATASSSASAANIIGSNKCPAFPATNSIHPNGSTAHQQLCTANGERHLGPGRESDQQ